MIHPKRLATTVAVVMAAALLTAAGPVRDAQATGAQAAAVPTFYQRVVTPGYNVYCRWDPHLLIGNGNGTGCFESSGDYFAIADTNKNGKGVAVLWRGGGKRGICRNPLGAKDFNLWPTCDFSSTIQEGIRIRARVGECNVTSTRNCRRWGHFGNLGPERTYRTTHPAD